ncbi:MAG TPA: NAD-dependent epimerase/dehydratase family protein [Sphingomicrobium sp.]
MPRTYLVTGGAGFIGSHLCDALLGDGHQVVVVDDLRSGHRSNLPEANGALKLIEGDVRDLPRIAPEIGPVDAIVHLAALISGYDSLAAPDDYVSVNVDGLLRVIQFAAERKVPRIVFASSSTVYGDQQAIPLSETTPPQPLTVYALTKLAGEHLLRLYSAMHGFTHCSLRLFNVYGPRQATDHPYANVTCKFSHAAANGLPVKLYGDGRQSRDFVYVADVVRAFLAVLEGSQREVYNVGTGETARIKDLIAELGGIVGRALEVEQCAPWPNDIRSIRADTSRFETEFGFRPQVPLSEGLRQTVEFFREEATRAAQ